MTAETAGLAPAVGPVTRPNWWRHGSFYQIYPWSFTDSDGDGVGDLPGIRSRIPHLRSLGIDAIWITPWFPSPLADGGYDVADYFSVHPSLGTMEDIELLIADAGDADIGVLFDLVANHTSDRHPRFRQALAAGPGSAERAWYHFLPPTSDGLPPNDWQGSFGGSAWTRVPDGEWYLHSFDRSQPDLNWRNPAVGDFFEDVIRFWVGKGLRDSAPMWPTASRRTPTTGRPPHWIPPSTITRSGIVTRCTPTSADGDGSSTPTRTAIS